MIGFMHFDKFVATSRQNSDEEEEEGEDIDYSPEEDEFKKVSIYIGSHAIPTE